MGTERWPWCLDDGGSSERRETQREKEEIKERENERK